MIGLGVIKILEVLKIIFKVIKSNGFIIFEIIVILVASALLCGYLNS